MGEVFLSTGGARTRSRLKEELIGTGTLTKMSKGDTVSFHLKYPITEYKYFRLTMEGSISQSVSGSSVRHWNRCLYQPGSEYSNTSNPNEYIDMPWSKYHTDTYEVNETYQFITYVLNGELRLIRVTKDSKDSDVMNFYTDTNGNYDLIRLDPSVDDFACYLINQPYDLTYVEPVVVNLYGVR